MGRGLQMSAQTMQREDPLPHELFGCIKQAISRVVSEKIRLLSAQGRSWVREGAA
jgi:hypothetical protein